MKISGYQHDYEYVRLGTLSLLAALNLIFSKTPQPKGRIECLLIIPFLLTGKQRALRGQASNHGKSFSSSYFYAGVGLLPLRPFCLDTHNLQDYQ